MIVNILSNNYEKSGIYDYSKNPVSIFTGFFIYF